MKKPLKVLSAASLATVFATTALIPVASAEQPKEQSTIAEFGVIQNDKILKVTEEDYTEALLSLSSVQTVEVFVSNTGLAYYEEDFNEAFVSAGTISGALDLLANDSISLALDLKQVDAYIDNDGKFVYDEQPEDRLNETFFYNFAA